MLRTLIWRIIFKFIKVRSQWDVMSVISRSRDFDRWIDDLVSFLYNMFDFQVEALLIDWNEKVIVQHHSYCLPWNLGQNSMVPRLEKLDIYRCFFLLDLLLSGVWSFLTGVCVYVIFSRVFLVKSIDKFLWRKNRYRYPNQL